MWIFSSSIYTHRPKSCLCKHLTLFLFVCEIPMACSVFNGFCSRFNTEVMRQAKSQKQMWGMTLYFSADGETSHKRGRCRSLSLHLPRVAQLSRLLLRSSPSSSRNSRSELGMSTLVFSHSISSVFYPYRVRDWVEFRHCLWNKIF